MYSSNVSVTLALDGVGGQRHAPAALSPGTTRDPLYRRLGVCVLHCSELAVYLVIPNCAAHIYQKGPNNTCNHTTELTTSMYFN